MKILTFIVLSLLAVGCAQRPVAEETPAPDPRAVTILDGEDGSVRGWREVVEASLAADVVIIGEMHGHPLGLDVAASLWEDMLAEAEGAPALCLEFIDRDHQAAVDDYLLDVINEEAFRSQAKRSAGNYPAGHARMVDAAKSADVRVYAANAPRRYTTLARREGLDALRALRGSQQRLYDVPESLREGAYRDSFFALMGEMMASHGGADMGPEAVEAQVEGLYRAQCVWDETMAASVSRALSDGAAPVMHVVGQFHVDHDGGLLQALRERRPDVRVVTVTMDEGDGTELTHEDVGRADFVVMVGER